MVFLTVFTITKIFNVIDYETISNKQLKKLSVNKQKMTKIISFYIGKTNKYIYKIGYIVNTIDGRYIIPIQNGNEIRQKYNIKKELLKVYPKIEEKRKSKKYLILIKYSNLPVEVIDKIMEYY
jgi:hypothetical protein